GVDLRGQGERPVEVVVVALLAAFFPHLVELAGQVVEFVSDAESDGQVTVFERHPFNSHTDAEIAVFLVAVGLDRRFAEDLPEDVASDLVTLSGLRVEKVLSLLLPVLLRERHQLPAVLGFPEELRFIKLLDRRLDLCQWGGRSHPIDKEGGYIRFGAGQIPEELQEANGLGNLERPTLIVGVVLETLADLVNVRTFLAGEVALDQF